MFRVSSEKGIKGNQVQILDGRATVSGDSVTKNH